MESKITTMHFTVDPSIINLPRDLFWYEDKKDQAYRVLDALSSGKLTLNQCKWLLDGEAYFTTEDDGETLTFHHAPDVEWQRELAVHKKYLAEKESVKSGKVLVSATEYDGYNINDKNTVLMTEFENYLKTEEVPVIDKEQLQLDVNKKLALQVMTQNSSTDPLEIAANQELVAELYGKIYSFDFEGHHYSYDNSARNQGECPHCGNRARGMMWSVTDDKEAFIGVAEFQKNNPIVALCFECPKCFKKFYYHQNKRYVKGMKA